MQTLAMMLLIISGVLVLAGVVYFAIIAPTMRRRLQYRVFRIRDAGRNALLNQQINTEAFNFIEDRCNMAIRIIDFIDLYIVYRIINQIASMSDEDRRELTSEYDRLSQLPVVSSLSTDISSVVRKAVMVNSGFFGLMFWTLYALSRLVGSVRSAKAVRWFTNSTRRISIQLPTHAVDQLRVHPTRNFDLKHHELHLASGT